MRLIPELEMPPFARMNWISQSVRDEWEGKIKTITKLYYSLEELTVQHGIRDCTTRHISPQNLEREMYEFSKKGLYFLPIQAVGSYSGFAHKHPPVVNGRPWAYYGVLSNSISSAESFVHASKYSEHGVDHDTIGSLLGYPDCCKDFFHKEWGQGYVDPVWQQAMNVSDEHVLSKTENKIRIKSSIHHELSPLLRYVGIRFAPNIPCSLDCKHSSEMVNKWVQLAKGLKLDGVDDLINILHMPMSWDVHKGIAVVSTPLFKVTTNSMSTYERYIVEKEGDFYPKGVPTGLKFPYQIPAKYNKINELRKLQAEGLIPILK